MELGDGAELGSNNRTARSDGGKVLMGDGGLKVFGDVRCVEQACGSGREAHVGHVEESSHEVGDEEKTLGFCETAFCEVGCSTISSIDMSIQPCAHSPTDFKPYSNGPCCEVAGCEKAIGNESEAGNTECAGSYKHPVFNSQIDCNTALYISYCQVDCSERASCNGIETLYEVGNDEEACYSGLVWECEEGNGEFQGRVSPRISFSRDFVMVDLDSAVPSSTLSSSSRVSPEKRKWEQQDDDSLDFEFLRHAPTREGAVDPANGCMLSADELFCNGKLLPAPFCNHWSPCDGLYLPSTADEEHCQQSAKLSLYKSSASRPMARHLSFEISRPHCTTSHVTFSCASSPSRVPHGDSSSCVAPGLHSSSSSMSIQSPPKSSSLVPSPSLSVLSSPSSKYSAKLKEIFKLRKGSTDSLPSELRRDNSFTATCRLPISPRSFWPFARSSSICDNKSSTAQRRILEMDATSLTSISSQNVDGKQDVKSYSSSMSEPLKIQGEVSNAEALLESQALSNSPCNTVVCTLKDGKECNASTMASRYRESASPSELLKKKMYASSSFARGSPGRRGGTIKVNTGKIVLRNLERCSAEKRLGRDEWKGLSKRSSYCAATRVSPVLNVAIYRGGNASKNGFFSFGSLFSSRKNKKPMESAAINWRKGA